MFLCVWCVRRVCSAKRSQKIKRYVLVASESMWELGIWVFVLATHANEITNVSTAFEATGLSIAKELTGKQLGNKVRCSYSFKLKLCTPIDVR